MIQPDKIIRSRRKTLAISIDSFGRLTVRAPLLCSEERIFAFLREKEAWIVKKQAQRQGAGISLPPENLHGYKLLLLGKYHEISLTDIKEVRFDKENLRIFLPIRNSRERLVKWLKDNAKRIFTAETERIAKEMGVRHGKVSVNSAKSHWGVCSGKNDIRYSFRLLYAPKEVISYVIVHELAHTRYKNHSASFWKEVERYEPDWKEKRRWLKIHGGLMAVF